MRPRLFHRTDPRINSKLQSLLSHECAKIGVTQTVVAEVIRERVCHVPDPPIGEDEVTKHHKQNGKIAQ